MTNPLKILVIGSTYPRHADDYAVPWMRESHAQLAARGHEITVLASSYKGLGDHEIDGIQVKRFRYAPSNIESLTHEQGAPYKIRKPGRQLLAIPYIASGCRAAAKLARREQYDIIHVHWPFPHGLMGITAARACGAPLVMTSHGAGLHLADRKPWITPVLRYALNSADLLIANSSDTATRVENVCDRDSEVIPFGSTVHAHNSAAPKNEIPRVLFTGRLIQRKGVEYLLQAIPKVLAKQKVQFVITGDGDQRPMLECIAAELNLGDSVEFLGFVSNEELDEQYRKCDVWVNPSVVDQWGDTEGLGVGSIEAYLHRKPVVASAVGGIPDTVVNDKTGYLVPQRDDYALADAILKLTQNPERAQQFGEAGFEFAKQKFSWDSITDKMESLYRGLLDRDLARPNAAGLSGIDAK